MKNRGFIIFLIVFMSIMAIGIACLLVFLLRGNIHMGNFSFFPTKAYEKVLDTSYELKRELIINSDASDIKIVHGNDKEIKVVVYGESKRLKVFDDENLTIDYRGKKCIGICFGDYSSRIEIFLPISYDGKIKVNNKYGDVEIASFEKAEVTTDLDYGDTIVKGGNKVSVKSSAGDVSIGNARSIEVTNHFGDIKIDEVTEKLDITADCGDIKITKVSLTKNSSIKNSMGNVKIKRISGVSIMADISLGDEDINGNDPTSNVLLTIKNSCGDIEVA